MLVTVLIFIPAKCLKLAHN